MSTIYVSTDIESNGPIPGKYSMLSFGSAAFTINKEILGTFEINLAELPDATQHPDTMKFWSKNQEAYNMTRVNPVEARTAMRQYHSWLLSMRRYGRLVFVGYPAAFDFMFIRYYLEYFVGECVLGYDALDVKSFASGYLNMDYTKTYMNKITQYDEPGTVSNHVAIDDAIRQGYMFINLLREQKGLN